MVEGNRRLCSLKLLRGPKRAPAPNRKAFKRLADRKPILPRSLEIAVFSNRDIANQWIALKHGGQQGGIGTKSWNASQSSRFKNSLSTADRPNSLSLAILDYAVNAGLLTVEQQNGIALTTVTRYLTSPVVRNALGVTDRRELIVNVDRSEFNSVPSHFLEDIFSGTVHSRSNSTERAEYGRNLIASGHAPATKLPNSYSPSEQITPESASNSKVTATANDDSARRRNNRNPDFGKRVKSPPAKPGAY